MTFHPRSVFVAALSLAMLGSCGDEERNAASADPVQLGGALPVAGDNTLIFLAGEVVSTMPTSFVLDYGPDRITVEMDDWDPFSEGIAINPGDRVTVAGRVDANLLAAKSIEASSVYIRNLNTTLYASSADEEGAFADTVLVLQPRNVDVTGRVTAIEGREFTVGSPTGRLRIDTAGLSENPLDDEGVQQIDVGDRVYAWGVLSLAGAESELAAEGVVTLTPHRRRDDADEAGSDATGNTNAAN